MNGKYTPEELELLHAELYDILGETIRVCKKHDIPYFVIGGTAIGALYDRGILPWDDDIDIGMKREDYNRFLKVAPQELSPSYFLSWVGTERTPYYFAKVKKNNTLFIEGMFKQVPVHPGIFIDIFPFDRIPDNKILRKLQYEAVNFLKCCLMGKEAWLWKHCGKCETDNPSNRGFVPCLLNRIIDLMLPKKMIYRLMTGTQSLFNSWNTKYYNNVITKTDHVLAESLRNLQPVCFGPLTVTAPYGLEEFLRYNYPTLHRYSPEEQEKANTHYPVALSFSTDPATIKISPAPVAMFVYNRVDNTRITIEYLKRNAMAENTELYIFSDGGRDERSWKEVNEVRAYLRTIDRGFRAVHLIERPENYYLERNITEGLAEVLAKHESVILLEDDICTSPVFLKYMNDALDKYRNEKRVMHIAGFTNLDVPEMGDTYFTPHMSGAGAWATWRDRWQHFTHYRTRSEALSGMDAADIDKIEYGGVFPCLRSLDRDPIPWDICWTIAIRRQKGLCLTPTHTLIRNIGLGKGTHFSTSRLFGWFEYDRPYRTEPVTLNDIPIEENPSIEALYARALKNHGMRYNLLGKCVRYVYLMIKKIVNQ